MNLAGSDAAPKAAPTLVCIEEIIATKRKPHCILKIMSVDWDPFLLDFMELELHADQTVGELARLTLLLAADGTQLLLYRGQLFIG